jgi:glutamyl-tRNA synthetase
MEKQIITRFAPSPTGYLHVGGARTALYNWLFARRNNGKFILRIEDTDEERSTQESTDGILESMKWLGLDWDEGPYFQSERLPIYFKYLDQLKAEGKIYPAFETKEELEASRAKAMAEKRNPIYDRASLKLSQDEIEARMQSGVPFAWRFKIPDTGDTIVPELLMGSDQTRFKNDAIGDFIISRPGTLEKPGMPLYNFVCAIDDALMKITHVIRGVEHFTNAARQVLLHQAIGNEIPTFLHLPLIMKNGKKMSKRDVDADGKFPVSVAGRAELGYLPAATLNHLALLGWSHPDGKEFFEVKDMLETFDLNRLSKANANFDEKKYLHCNSSHIIHTPEAELLKLLAPFFAKAGIDTNGYDQKMLESIVALEKPRCKTLSEFPDALGFFFKPLSGYEEDALKTMSEDSLAAVEAVIAKLKTLDTLSHETLEAALANVVETMGIPFKVLGISVRLALTGRTKSPGLPDIISILGAEESIRRLEAFKAHITKTPLLKNAG